MSFVQVCFNVAISFVCFHGTFDLLKNCIKPTLISGVTVFLVTNTLFYRLSKKDLFSGIESLGYSDGIEFNSRQQLQLLLPLQRVKGVHTSQ